MARSESVRLHEGTGRPLVSFLEPRRTNRDMYARPDLRVR